LDLIQVKGKTVGVNIFALLGDEEMAQECDFRILKDNHEQMITAYRHQGWEQAMAKLKECRVLGEPFGLTDLYNLYEARIAQYEADPPGSNWSGVYIATSK
jgi:adenylate cyclase